MQIYICNENVHDCFGIADYISANDACDLIGYTIITIARIDA